MSPEEFNLPDERIVPEFTTTGHLTEGTVGTWLDGVFDMAAVQQVEAHVQACPECAAMAAEARGLIAASARILRVLDTVPVGVAPRTGTVRAAVRIATETHGSGSPVSTVRVTTAVPATSLESGGSTDSDRSDIPGNDRIGAEVKRYLHTWWYPAAAAAATLVLAIGMRAWLRAGYPAQDSGYSLPTAAGAPSPSALPLPQPGSPEQQLSLTPEAQSMDASGTFTPEMNFSAATTRRMAAVSGMTREQQPAPYSSPVTPGTVIGPGNGEQYDRIEDNPFLDVTTNPLSTFSIDVDRASYANVRRFLENGQQPPADAVRIEELINYFPYDLPAPRGNDPVSITTEVAAAPWQPSHQLVRIALQSRRISGTALPPSNLVFLIDVSGSMSSPNKLPLVKQALRLLVDQLREQDRVAVVTYRDGTRLALPSTSGDEKERIVQAIEALEAGGSTAGSSGIEMAYRVARDSFVSNGNNRVILTTDGDFNVGASSDGELERLIEQKRDEGTYLTVLGFGTGNYQDAKMEKLARSGNGNYAYVDNLAEARKALVHEMGATLLTVANDTKLQVEFNPRRVQSYRLVGYEDRLLRNEDFTDDHKDAGDLGAGHQVTALYELVPVGVTGTVSLPKVQPRRYQQPGRASAAAAAAGSDELLFVNLRYKLPGESTSRLMTHAVRTTVGKGSIDMRFISSVASFGMLLRSSVYKGSTSIAQVLDQARAALGRDEGGYRAGFVRLVELYRDLDIREDEPR